MNNKDILSHSLTIADEVVGIRRHLHSHPELSFEERQTADYIAAKLDSWGIAYERACGTAIIARVDGRSPSAEAVVLRADTDALPITEATGLPYSSCNHGVMHSCGHDMHTAMLLGALRILHEAKDQFDGTVVGLFQPAEEKDPGGASIIVSEGVLQKYSPKVVVGQHVSADLEVGFTGFCEGTSMASGDEVHIVVRGRGGHAAMPDKLADPVVAASQLVVAMQQVVSRNMPPLVPTVLSFGRFVADGATNIIPDTVTLAGTLRTMDEHWREQAKRHIRQTAEGICAAFGTVAEVDIRDGYPCVYNDPKTTQRAAKVAAEVFGADKIVWQQKRMTAEDFGYYTHLYPSVFFRTGIGAASGRSHNPKFNPDEEAMKYGVATMIALALDNL